MINPRFVVTVQRRARCARPTTARLAKPALFFAVAVLLSSCSTLPSWVPTIPVPSIPWFGHGEKKPGPLPSFDAKAAARVNWQLAVGERSSKGGIGFAPAIEASVIYAAASDGSLVSANAATGKQNWRINVGKALSAGVGADANAVAVGTNKGEVLAFDTSGKPLWQVRVSSEVAGPPKIADGLVLVWSLDGRIFALSETDGTRKWVYQRTNPPLTVRRFPGGNVSRGALFTGTAGGKLLAIDVSTGTLGWEGNVATPKGATELERIADITSLPVIEARQVCAAAYQGRVACFDAERGTLVWSRDFSSLAGITIDNRYLYVTDDKGAIQALDKTTGGSVWKQDKLAARFPSGPVAVGDYLGVVDAEGYLHLIDRNDGNLVGRVATDGAPPMSQPIAAADAAIWQTTAGTLISASAK